MADPNVNVRQGARLPHWTKEGATYAVNFRLGDSLPQTVLESWRFEREDILQTARQQMRPVTEYESKRLDELFSERVDKYLDGGMGKCWLREQAHAQVVADALGFFDGDRYQLSAWCVMPNHVHAVVHPLGEHELPGILHSWKSYTANEINRALERRGQFWEPEYYDHLVRDELDFHSQVAYVQANPQKAGLKDWKWVATGSGTQPRRG